MGIISQLASETKGVALNSGIGTPRNPSGGSRDLWRNVFRVNKETEDRFPPVRRPIPGGSFARSAIAEPAAYKRLLQAMRSMAPGGWSDNRWEQTKHFTGIAYVAIRAVCLQLQQAEFQVFKKDLNHQNGKRPITPYDPPEGDRVVKPYDLIGLLQKPNNQDSFGKLMYRWGQQLRLTGTALTWMVPNALGTPMELYPIPTSIAIPQPAINPDYPDGYYRIQPIYPYGPFSSYPTPATAVGAPIPAQWMLRFIYPHPLLRYDGYSPLTGLRLHLDEVESVDRSRWYSMKRAVDPSAVLQFEEMDGALPLPAAEIERIRAEFENTLMGPENNGQLYVSAPGSRLEPWGARPLDMEYQAGWDQLTSFCLGGLGITKPAAGMIEDSSYATLFATLKQLNVLTLEPECNDIASYLTRDLAKYFGDDLIVEITTKRIDDHDLTNAKLQIAMNARAITKNEVLRILDLPMTKEEWGEEIAGTEPQPEGGDLASMLDGGGGADPTGGSKLVAPQDQINVQEPSPFTGQVNAPGEEAVSDPSEIQRNKPKMGSAGRGALGPRKSLGESRLVNIYKKSLYQKVREALSNDNSVKNGSY